MSRSEWRTLELPKTGNEPLKITQRLLGRGFFLIALPVPGPEFVEGESVGGTGFDPWFLVGLGGVGFVTADHLGTVTLDGRGGAFAGPGFAGLFEDGMLKPWVVALVHHDDMAEVTGAATVVQFPVESGGHRFAAGAYHEDEMLEKMFSLQTMAPFFTFAALASGRAGWKPGPLGASGREHQNPESST